MKYTESHEWITVTEGVGTVGITTHAQKELGEVVYVELPKLQAHTEAGGEIAVLESTKAAVDIYSPVSGKVTEVNGDLKETPELINQSPEDKGWLFKIKLSDKEELKQLMDVKAYQEML